MGDPAAGQYICASLFSLLHSLAYPRKEDAGQAHNLPTVRARRVPRLSGRSRRSAPIGHPTGSREGDIFVQLPGAA
ncbi:hypothetical protein CALVIDRAFT_62159 [Calocera viscosa TUFC12733]|uniref:Uncharacterized protein n=1 Tax=Calocera viscosa (strain TUFC12733) TaxID=1330018 RepID=A0A167NMC5_CALVF|nr:hypothetical protein CALVIDRAFT_62159 [Calocera viscosa TUFC12733]